MNGRFFDGRQVIATLFDGKASKFKRSDRQGGAATTGNDDDDDGEGGAGSDEKHRLDAFAAWLEQDGANEVLASES
jgi:HIV Tat-specific factor 1